jgi:hypothetical protein
VDDALRAIARRKDGICPERPPPCARQFQKEVYDMAANTSSLLATVSGQIENGYLTLANGFGAEGESDGFLNPAASSRGLDPGWGSPPPDAFPLETTIHLRMRLRLI